MSILNQLHTATNVGSGEAISTRGRTGATLKTHTVEYPPNSARRMRRCAIWSTSCARPKHLSARADAADAARARLCPCGVARHALARIRLIRDALAEYDETAIRALLAPRLQLNT